MRDNRFSGFQSVGKPLKRFWPAASPHTPLKRGVNESAANTVPLPDMSPTQKLSSAPASPLPPASDNGAHLRGWQLRIFWLLWGVRLLLPVPRQFRRRPAGDPEGVPDWTTAQVGMIPSVYAMFYAVGQIINGTLGQRFGARR